MDTFEAGIPGIYDIPAPVYHGAPGFSNSMAGHMDPPARLPAYLEDNKDFEPTIFMVLGTLIHQRILEPAAPMPKLAIEPSTYGPEKKKWHNGAGECKAWRQAQIDAGRIPMKQDQLDSLIGCIDAVKANPIVANLFSERGVGEVSLFTEFDGVLTKARLDYVPPSRICRALVDIKKVQEGNAEREAFINLAVRRGYHRQAAHYLDSWNYWFPDDQRDAFLFIVVEEQKPYLTNVIPMGPKTIARGRVLNDEIRARYKECKALNVWPGYPMSLKPIEASDWNLEKEF